MFVRVDKAMYGLIQSPKLWYKELTQCLMSHGFKICKSAECILHKKTQNGKDIILILYVDDILVMSGDQETRLWVRDTLEREYEKITFGESKKFTYLGMVLTRNERGFNISMRSYVDDILEMYGSDVKECVTPAKTNLFTNNPSPLLEKQEKELFHSIVAKLLYLGKRGRPDILLAVQFLCTRVKVSTCDDRRKLERVLGYLKFSKNWSRLIDNSKFECIETYIEASFAMHEDGKSQSGCMTFLGNTLVHEGCRKQKLITKNSEGTSNTVCSDCNLSFVR